MIKMWDVSLRVGCARRPVEPKQINSNAKLLEINNENIKNVLYNL